MAKLNNKPLTAGEKASLGGPRPLKEPGSVDWCHQTVHALQALWMVADRYHERYLEILKEADSQSMWDFFPPEKPYGSREVMLQALEVGDEEDVKRRMLQVGRPKKGEEINVDGHQHFQGGTERAYLEARLERDHPDILEAFLNGKYPSVWAAAKAAGFVREHPNPRVRLPVDDPDKLAEILKRKLTPANLELLITALQNDV
jgi:hypothetical protein